MRPTLTALSLAVLTLPLSVASAEMPDAIAAPGQTLVAVVHAEGAQLYECKTVASGKLAWQFREPIATLVKDGKTVGRHYAGPIWEMADSSAVAAKVAARAPGATAKDVPLLKLDVVSQRGSGQFGSANTVQRLNTRGDVAEGPCTQAGTFLSVPYSAVCVLPEGAVPVSDFAALAAAAPAAAAARAKPRR